MDVYSDLPHCYNGISDVSFYTKDPNESSPTNVNNQGGLGYESYRGPGMSLAVSPTLFSVPSAFAQDQPNQFASGDLDITDPYKSALRRADQPNHDSFVKVDQEFSSTTGVILRTGPIGKQCRRRYCPQKWAAIQSIVQRLYMDQGRSLHETMRILEEEHSFKASEKQIKNKIKCWGFAKNKKSKAIDGFGTSGSSAPNNSAEEGNLSF